MGGEWDWETRIYYVRIVVRRIRSKQCSDSEIHLVTDRLIDARLLGSARTTETSGCHRCHIHLFFLPLLFTVRTNSLDDQFLNSDCVTFANAWSKLMSLFSYRYVVSSRELKHEHEKTTPKRFLPFWLLR